jgi:hypothetical protein
MNLTTVARNSRSLQKAEEQLSLLSSQAAKALSKLEQCERRVHLLRQQTPRPDSEGAVLAKAKVKVLPGGLVKGDSSGECTFSPSIAANSRRIMHETRRSASSFNERMEAYLQRKRHNISEISREVSHAVSGVGQRELRKRQEAATFFHEVLGWDVVQGVSPAEIERVLHSPQNFGVKITEVRLYLLMQRRCPAAAIPHSLNSGRKGCSAQTQGCRSIDGSVQSVLYSR